MQKNINKILITVFISLGLVILITMAIIFRIRHIKNQKPTANFTESSASWAASSSESAVSLPQDNGIKLVILNPASATVSTTEPTFTFSGTSDKEEKLTINETEIKRESDGSFTHTVNLKIGKNYFKFSHKDTTVTYTVNYRYIVISSYTPSSDQSYKNGSEFEVTVTARNKSTVTAKFNSATIALTPQADSNDEFIVYRGKFSLPSGNLKDIVYNPIVFTATYNGITESFESGKITCKKPDSILDSDPSVTPQGSNYIDVGSGKIAEIVHYEAETFDAYSTNDWSRPTNNYLPKGTVDYSAQEYVYHKSGSEIKEYTVLRCGKQVYTTHYDKPYTDTINIVKEYMGTLPDHNEIELASLINNGEHTVLTLNTMWKAPFNIDIAPQAYENPSKQKYGVSQFTANYIDITFCYATILKGDIIIPQDNPLFSSGMIIENYDKNGKIIDITLRLNFKKTGGFYGWNVYYNDQGQLVFEFLNPQKITVANNEYGADLTGVTVLIDVGHGGKDPGASGADSNHSEANQNLIFAKELKRQLGSLGATVYLTREDNITSSTDDKIKMLKRIKPDICIAIHHNSSTVNRNANGFDSYYFNPFSMNSAYYIYRNTVATNIYKKNNLGWHYYYVARSTVCPVVLTENGYMSNSYDYQNIINNTVISQKAKAITKGIAEYFLSL